MPDSQPINAIIYALHEPILALLKAYNEAPPEPEIFSRIQTHLAASGIQTMDTIIFGNSENNPESIHPQTLLQTAAVLRPGDISDHEPLSPVLELTARVLTDLHENPAIDVFIIIADSLELIPLLQVIKYKNKLAYLISPQTGPAAVLVQYAHIHEFLEDMLNLLPPAPANRQDAI
jgi:hypothetical protein